MHVMKRAVQALCVVTSFPWGVVVGSSSSSSSGAAGRRTITTLSSQQQSLSSTASSSYSRAASSSALFIATSASAGASASNKKKFHRKKPSFVNNKSRSPAAANASNSIMMSLLSTTSSSTNSNNSSNNNDNNNDTMEPIKKNRVALLQMPVTPSKSRNLRTAEEYVRRAREAGAALCVLPEIWNSPYATSAFEEYSEVLPSVGDSLSSSSSSSHDSNTDNNDNDNKDKAGEKAKWGKSSILLMELAKSTGMYIVGGSIPEVAVVVRSDSDDLDDANSDSEDATTTTKIYNTCLIIDPAGEIVGKHRKVHLFDVDVPGGIRFKESETLTAGEGATYFDCGDYNNDEDDDDDDGGLGRIGVGICYDIRFPEYAMLLTQMHQCKILIYPGAFNLTTGPAHWELLQRARAVDGQCYVLTASPARMPPPASSEEDEGVVKKNEYPHYSAWGHSTVVSPWGEVVATCDEKPGMVVADLDMGKVGEMRIAIPTMGQKRHDLYKLVRGDE